MFDRLSNDDIASALNQLISCFGIKEDMAPDDLYHLLRENKTEACVQKIAVRLGLPIRISLSYVPKDFKPDNTDGFRSSALSRTDWTGRGIESITAQVSIPQNLPMFWTSDLQGYPIKVRVSENCCEHPGTFVAIMAHEFSHVILASLRSPHKDSELHTDLVPILLGFRDAVRNGRKTVRNTSNGATMTTHTTTYGYLTDSQFEFACNYVTSILEGHQRDRKNLIEATKKIKHKLKKAARNHAAFRDYFKYIDSKHPDKMKAEHAKRVVQLYAQDFSTEWRTSIAAIRISQESAESFVRQLDHYTSSTVEHLKINTEEIELAAVKLGEIIKAIAADKKMMRKYVSIIYRIRRTLLPHS